MLHGKLRALTSIRSRHSFPRLTRKEPRVSLLKYFWHAENACHGLQPNVAVEFFAALERPLRETAK